MPRGAGQFSPGGSLASARPPGGTAGVAVTGEIRTGSGSLSERSGAR